jgi:hypothetical protein
MRLSANECIRKCNARCSQAPVQSVSRGTFDYRQVQVPKVGYSRIDRIYTAQPHGPIRLRPCVGNTYTNLNSRKWLLQGASSCFKSLPMVVRLQATLGGNSLPGMGLQPQDTGLRTAPAQWSLHKGPESHFAYSLQKQRSVLVLLGEVSTTWLPDSAAPSMLHFLVTISVVLYDLNAVRQDRYGECETTATVMPRKALFQRQAALIHDSHGVMRIGRVR